jgi:hypothetical protein
MNQVDDLSLEQQFSLRLFSEQVRQLSCEAAQDLLIELNRQMMIKDNLYRQLIRPDWSLD